ncbi:MAG: Uma2 family endonuclease, partial [Crocosphaera sp.]|nr:Uma2 family endonuclease [Crocosphaera sp.]
EPNEKGWLWSQQLGLYLGIDNNQLRFFTPEGKLVLTPEETAERLAKKLQEMGINPDEIDS